MMSQPKRHKRKDSKKANRPNILVLMVDEMRWPCSHYKNLGGMIPPLREIFNFSKPPTPNNAFLKFFPGLTSLRQNAVVLKNHFIAASACAPSRATMLTGHYGSNTGVTQTDGIFKNGEDHRFPWLKPEGLPTVADYFNAAGYSSHYFGKWHLSHVPAEKRGHGLLDYGFQDWEKTWPDADGGMPEDLGTYRDFQIAKLAVDFIHQKTTAFLRPKKDEDEQPFFAMISLVNPHDIGTYPRPWWGQVLPGERLAGPKPIPPKGAEASISKREWNPGDFLIYQSPPVFNVPLNPDGFPQLTFSNPPTIWEDLGRKPRCQYEYAYKMQLALEAKWPEPAELLYQFPWQNAATRDLWYTGAGQFYSYLHYLMDLSLRQITDAIYNSPLRENTIIVFTSDHGDLSGAHHGMIQKFHNAYEETLRVPTVISSPLINENRFRPRVVEALTSHIDLTPTLLGLAGLDDKALAIHLPENHHREPFVGADLSPLIRNEVETVTERFGSERSGVLFITDDEITAQLRPQHEEAPADSLTNLEVESSPTMNRKLAAADRKAPDEFAEDYKNFEAYVIKHNLKSMVQADGALPYDPHHLNDVLLIKKQYQAYLETGAPQDSEAVGELLAHGPVRQPSSLRCFRTHHHKFVRYYDPTGEYSDEFEFYSLEYDPIEAHNLVRSEAGLAVFEEDYIPAEWKLSPQEKSALKDKMAEMELALHHHCKQMEVKDLVYPDPGENEQGPLPPDMPPSAPPDPPPPSRGGPGTPN